jgi:Histidine kinase
MILNFYIPPEERRDMLGRLLVVYLYAAVITLAVSTVPDRRALIVEQLVYSYGICTLNWLFVDVGDLMVFKTAGKRFPFSGRRYLFAFFAVMVAHILGTMIGDWYSGWQMLTKHLPAVFMWHIVLQIGTFSLIWFFTQRHHHKEDQRSTNEARLRLLESQLEPHMLFNTLANLRALIGTDPALATQMLDRIVNYMRATLGGSLAMMHPLREEFARLDDYLDLMKLRMGERLNYRLYLCPNLDNYLVPPFILQPLVENAIKHGLEPQIEGGRIFIVANIERNRVSLEVNDTGTGAMAEDLLKTKGFGWAQVSERLAATYGGNATINLVALEGYSTSAKITFPHVEHVELESSFE